ncbi:DMT family transporter [Inquilinus sp.]|jgi:transporter family-2 protein|uniref:DMT family transporter n=1 Tax=Inquilinus sp. TaxID=1932117 RepID=UPI003783E74E
MGAAATVALLATAGICLVLQNLLMVRITLSASTVLVALVLNSAVGLTLLTSLLLFRNGPGGVAEAVSALRSWAFLPGLLGSFFVFAGIFGYQRLGAAPTIAVLVASQLVAGLAADQLKPGAPALSAQVSPILGALLLIVGAVLVARGRLS